MLLAAISLMWASFLVSCVLGDESEDISLSQKCNQLIPGCDCFDLGEIAEVKCWNATEFFATSHLLDGSIFKVNTTFEITVEGGIKSLPPRSLEGLIVFRLTLDDPQIQDIDARAFEDLLRLRRFHVRQSSIKKVPLFRPIRHSLRNLNLDHSLLTALDGEALQDLPMLETISFFNNSIRTVQPDVFKYTNNVVIFDLSYNKISSLPRHLFDPWKKLRKVALSHNQLLHVDYLFAVARPFFVLLDYNNITDLDSILHVNMSNLQTLLVANNPIERVTSNSFNNKVPNIKFLYMDHCKIRKFDVRHYQNLTKLNTLDLSYNEIEIVPSQPIGFGFSLELVMEGNRIREFQAEMSFTVKRAYLANNKLRHLGKTLQFTQLTEVSVARNELQQLRSEDFKSVHGLSVLILNNNQIRWVDRLAFSNVRNDLHNLDLSCNDLTALNGSVRFLSQLKYLNLTSNRITVFEDGEFTGLNELSELYLHDNRIVALGGHLQLLPRLQFLVITSNRIRSLSQDQIPKTLQFLYFKDNPVRCECGLLPFLEWLQSSPSPGTDASLCTNQSDTPGEACPPECQCACSKGLDHYYMILDCSFRNLSSLPPFLDTNYSDENAWKSLPLVKIQLPRSIEITDIIGEVNLSNNRIKSLDRGTEVLSNLRRLYLHSNQLSVLPSFLTRDLPDLQRMSLSGNPWSCDCDAVEFKKWLLSKEDRIVDINGTRCENPNQDPELKNRLIWTLDDRDLCPTSIGLFFSIGFAIIAFFLGLTLLKLVYTRYELSIKVWLYAHGVTWVKEKDIDKDKRFDAFISFSHKDQNFVIDRIISVIEAKEPRIRLCLHYKHFVPGEYIHDNIVSAVQNSKRTILVLSKNFLESEWCLMEFRAAHVQALKDRVHRIVVIKIGDLPEDTLDPSIKLYLDNTTYLTWGEKYFWNNLFYALPTSGNTRTIPAFPLENQTFKHEPT